ncbi:GL19127 [Drosophila persimilis]|uniref:ribose-phosphate diphosphokinase n=1 Tax=Drosophila persimilis TaxID=7234 RepID=B4G6X7_DROPE|nr:ribose-phosphate pyrophosphokinase 2 [Drosophila persimilis]EDW28296.1 GL19127 [Drosophila persimilis]
MHRLVVVSGSSHCDFADVVAESLGLSLHPVLRAKFPNGEIRFELLESVRGADVYIVQTSCEPVNDMLMELLVMVQACRYASANTITAVMPLFPYSRQDKMDSWKQPITAKLVANMLSVAGVNRVLTMQLHNAQLQGFFDIPCDNLQSDIAIESWIKRFIPDYAELVIVGADKGAVKTATHISHKLGTHVALFHKQRRVASEVHDMILVGSVRGKVVVVVDDLADTSNTLCLAAERLNEAGAARIYAVVTHGVFSGQAQQKLSESLFELVVCTNTVPQPAEVAKNPRFHIIDVSNIFAKCIWNMHDSTSVENAFLSESSLLNWRLSHKKDADSVSKSFTEDEGDRLSQNEGCTNQKSTQTIKKDVKGQEN